MARREGRGNAREDMSMQTTSFMLQGRHRGGFGDVFGATATSYFFGDLHGFLLKGKKETSPFVVQGRHRGGCGDGCTDCSIGRRRCFFQQQKCWISCLQDLGAPARDLWLLLSTDGSCFWNRKVFSRQVS